MSERLRIGVLSSSSPTWSAGASYTRACLWSLARRADPERDRVYLIAHDDAVPAPPGVEVLRTVSADLSLKGKARRGLLRMRDRHASLPGEWEARRRLGLHEPSDPIHVARRAGIDVVVPMTQPLTPGVDVARVGWIPDFQHRFLPQYFNPSEIADRDANCLALASRSEALIFSSHATASDFRSLFPAYAHKARVAQFPSLFAFDPPRGDPREAARKYRLPEKFALVVNQLWAHKNHELVLDAVARARTRVPVVMIGAPFDYRDRRGEYLSARLQQIAGNGVADRVSLLGQVPFADLVGLLRSAAVVIQPSRFEGWSTTVEDAKALGRPLICSDIPVLREQAPGALGFAGCDDPDALAAILDRTWESLTPGPDLAREEQALATARQAADRYGDVLVSACRDAVRAAGRASR